MITGLRILMVCPAPPGSRKGNRVTALRWSRLLKELGHRVAIRQPHEDLACDLLVALHARKSAPAVARHRRLRPSAPLVVALTGTDVYRDIRTSLSAQRSLELATRLVVLQPHAVRELAGRHAAKARVILQSAIPTPGRRAGGFGDGFRVCVLGHLRHEKDPFRAALASRLLPAHSRIEIVQLGAPLSEPMGRWARTESERNPRYRWLGEVSYGRARRTLARSRLLVLSSRMEGGANVLSEAIVDGVPIVASDIPSTAAILGEDYPGLYPVGDTEALTRQLVRAEADGEFYARLKSWCRRLAPRFRPAAERTAWGRLVREIVRATQ